MIDFDSKRILVVVAHPDDEILGCGATINRLITEHDCIIRAVILGEGITSRSEQRDRDHWKEELILHKQNIASASAIIGYEHIDTHDFPDNRFDTVALLDVIKVIEKEKENFKPDIIFTHHGGDLNIDHQRTFESVITACRPMEDEVVKMIATFETPSGTEWQSISDPRIFRPNLFMSVSEKQLNRKIQAMECYNFEKRTYPHPRSPEALRILAQQRGLSVGVEYSEAFCIVRLML